MRSKTHHKTIRIHHKYRMSMPGLAESPGRL